MRRPPAARGTDLVAHRFLLARSLEKELCCTGTRLGRRDISRSGPTQFGTNAVRNQLRQQAAVLTALSQP